MKKNRRMYLFNKFRIYGRLFCQFPVELGIILFESVLFAKFLKGKTKSRKYVYGLAANLASWGIGFFLISHQYELLKNNQKIFLSY
ncbi:MAG TPA: hypothetical protein DCE02_03965 [Ruminiclostridium sp.]|uniref:hypothetical protein n=1 Tax=Acetivibrio saccincola TaxID=1677857 RepID=UPI000C6D0679|nr:hypothetical protein [Acetivibrio saccincola]NLW28135.1 hypothetical protein [Acetivibrio saccincola]HAA43145.1 hypothetical protein [Ruminiclostridium sp.]